jgi:RNA polymerase sigma factor (sigma-70 family)
VTESERERRRRFDQLFASYGSDVTAYCSWRAGSRSDGQDAAADVFLTAWRRLDDVPAGDPGRVWLYATARRVIANQRRSRRRRDALHDRLVLEATTSQPDSTPTGRDETLVHETLRRLGPRDREVLLLAEWEGLTPAQIASVLGCLTVTARGRLHRARRRFRTVFEQLLHSREREVSRSRGSAHIQQLPGGSARTLTAREGGS